MKPILPIPTDRPHANASVGAARPVTVRLVAWLHAASLLAVCALSAPAAADVGDVVETLLLPQGTGQFSGVTYDGTSLWVAQLQSAGEPTSQNALLRLDADGAVNAEVVGGAARPLQKIAWAGGSTLWAVRLYTELHALDASGQTAESWDIPFSQGLAGDPIGQQLWLLEGGSSNEIHVVQSGAVVASITTEATHQYWWGLAWDGCSLWTVDIEGDDRLLRLNAQTGAVLEELPAPSTRIAGLTFDGVDLIASDTALDALLRVEVGSVMIDGALCEPRLAPTQSDPVEPEDEGEDPSSEDPDEPADGEEGPADGTSEEDPGTDEEGSSAPEEEPSSPEGGGSSTPPSGESPDEQAGISEPPGQGAPDGAGASGDDEVDAASLLDRQHEGPAQVAGGCRCVAPGGESGVWAAFFAVALVSFAGRRRRR